jgi:hypothetical protein
MKLRLTEIVVLVFIAAMFGILIWKFFFSGVLP